jgi:hypothetical protein
MSPTDGTLFGVMCQHPFPFDLSPQSPGGGLIGMIRVDEIGRPYFEQDRSIKEILRALWYRATVGKVIRGPHNGIQYAQGAFNWRLTKRAVADRTARFAFRHHNAGPRQRNRGSHQRSDCSWIALRFNEIGATQRAALHGTIIGGRPRQKPQISLLRWSKTSGERTLQFGVE